MRMLFSSDNPHNHTLALGVMEAALRTAYWMVTGKEMDNVNITAVRPMKKEHMIGLREARGIEVGDLRLNVAVITGEDESFLLAITVYSFLFFAVFFLKRCMLLLSYDNFDELDMRVCGTSLLIVSCRDREFVF